MYVCAFVGVCKCRLADIPSFKDGECKSSSQIRRLVTNVWVLLFHQKQIGFRQSIYRKVAPGRLFTFKFLLFSMDLKNCNPSQWRHSIVRFTRWRHFSVHSDEHNRIFNSFFSRLLKIWKWHHSRLYLSIYTLGFR
jgi:hypothetical protein